MTNASDPPLYFLNNRYRVIQVLGEGGFGQTFLAEDTHMPLHETYLNLSKQF